MPYHSIDEILRRCRDRACPFWQVVLTTQAKETQLPESAVLDQMDQMAKAMEDSITQYDPTAVTTGKMGGQNGARLAEYNQKGDTLLGDYLSAVIAAAVQVAESNACMKRIVAAPTAGSCPPACARPHRPDWPPPPPGKKLPKSWVRTSSKL